MPGVGRKFWWDLLKEARSQILDSPAEVLRVIYTYSIYQRGSLDW